MITTNIEQVLKDLEKLHLDVVRRLEQMVEGFSYEFALTAIQKTPLGDVEEYLALYKARERRTGLEVQAGLAQGGWQIALDGSLDFQEIYSGKTALGAVKTHMMNYKLGETVIIGNTGPYIQTLENNYSGQTNGAGIIQPTIDTVMNTFAIDVVRYYRQ